MKIPTTRTLTAHFLLALVTLTTTSVMARSGDGERRFQRPPRAAVQACVNGADGATCGFVTPHGEKTGRCRPPPHGDGPLACVPESAETESSLSYPVLDTRQDDCYASTGAVIDCPAAGQTLAGQDAQHQGLAPSFSDTGDGTVTEALSGLTWSRTPDIDGDGLISVDDKLTLAEALDHCETLDLGGYQDWRLPDIKTLYSLIDFRGTDPSGYDGSDTSGLKPFIDTEFFDFAYGDTQAGERLIDAQYASSTLYVSESALDARTLFGVNFADGRIKGYGLDTMRGEKTFFVLCVRGNPDYGSNDFVDNQDGTVTDRATGLMWAQWDSGQEAPEGLDWPQALAWVDAQNAAVYLGHDDWRLPNVKELQSLLDYERAPDVTGSAAIDPVFQSSPIVNEAGQDDFAYVWTSTTHANWTGDPGRSAAYLSFGRALGYMDGVWIDVHGAGAQRSDPKIGEAAEYPYGHGPQGDAIRIFNDVRLVRDAS